ncbi:MAG: alpha/beta fold hydrolase [Tatlockia sp.]|nr:alpha/beta fold hydrolase [Tatlockia sp.]
MNIDSFRCMRRGEQISVLNDQDFSLIAPIEKTGVKAQRALFLIHGFSSTPAVYRLLEPLLTNCYDAVFCPVLAGHAENIDAFAKAKGGEWLAQVEQIYEALAKRFEQVDVMGLSLGGLLATHLSKHYRLSHLYLLAPALDLFVSLKHSIRLAKTLNWLGFRKIRAAAGNLYTANNYEIAYRQLPLTSIIEVLTLIHEFQFTAPTCPTDLFLGRYDEVVASQRVAERFSGVANINIHWLANSAHVLPLDGDIAIILQTIEQNSLINSLEI